MIVESSEASYALFPDLGSFNALLYIVMDGQDFRTALFVACEFL